MSREIVRVKPHESTYEHFRLHHLESNEPCVFPPSLVQHWSLFDKFFLAGGDGNDRLDYDYLEREYGSLAIECVDCDEGEEGEEGEEGGNDSNSNDVSTFGRLVSLWQSGDATGLYVKDWHLPLEVQQRGRRRRSSSSSSDVDAANDHLERELYTVPLVCLDDWINEYEGVERTEAERRADDFRFIYAGGGSTFTPLHRDVYCSYSISTQIYGRKLWYLFPPECTPLLTPLIEAAHRRGDVVDCDKWDDDTKARFARLGMLTVIQEAKETIFIPSGWYHSVHNLSHPTISLNHNWLNSHNLDAVYRSLSDEAQRCRDAIADVKELLIVESEKKRRRRRQGRDGLGVGAADDDDEDEDEPSWRREWEEQVDGLVERSEGWSWRTFWNMVLNTLESLDETHPPSSSSSSSSSSPQQLDYEKGGGGLGQESSPDGGTRQGTRRTRRPSRWPVVPRDCRPATDEIVATVRPLVRDFVVSRRDAEYGWLEGLRDVVDRVDRVVSVLAGESRT